MRFISAVRAAVLAAGLGFCASSAAAQGFSGAWLDVSAGYSSTSIARLDVTDLSGALTAGLPLGERLAIRGRAVERRFSDGTAFDDIRLTALSAEADLRVTESFGLGPLVAWSDYENGRVSVTSTYVGLQASRLAADGPVVDVYVARGSHDGRVIDLTTNAYGATAGWAHAPWGLAVAVYGHREHWGRFDVAFSEIGVRAALDLGRLAGLRPVILRLEAADVRAAGTSGTALRAGLTIPFGARDTAVARVAAGQGRRGFFEALPAFP